MCLGGVVTAFFHYFELADEGLYLYLGIQGHHAFFLTPYHILGHYVGNLFGHQLLGYRFLRLVVLLGSTAFFGVTGWRLFFKDRKEDSLYAFLIFLVSLMITIFYSLVQTMAFSYNAMAYLGVALWLGSFFALLGSGRVVFHGILMGIALVLSAYARPPLGIALLIMDYVFCAVSLKFYRFSFWRLMRVKWVVVLVCAGLSWLFFSDFFKVVPVIMALHGGASHEHLLINMLKTFKINVLNVLMYVEIFALFFVWNPRSKLGLMMLLVSGILYAAFSWYLQAIYRYELFGMLAGMLVFVSSVILLYNLYEQRIASTFPDQEFLKNIFFFAVCSSLAIMSSLGTNIDIMVHATEHAFPILAFPFMCVAMRFSNGFRERLIPTLACLGILYASAIVLILHNTVIEAYRIPPNELSSEQRYYSKQSPYMKGIRLSKPMATNIDAILTELKASGFDPLQDRVMAYVDVPGFVGVTGAQSFGIAWGGCEEDHAGSIPLMRGYFDLEPYSRPIRYVYVLINHEIDPEVRNKMDELLTPAPGFHKKLLGIPGSFCVSLGSFRPYQMTFEGPYLFGAHSR